jgi:CIC family chloride channel protein
MRRQTKLKLYYLRFLISLRALNHWRKKQLSGTNFLIVAAALVGILGGLAGSILKVLTHSIEHYLQQVDWGIKFYVLLIFPFIGILLTAIYIKTFIRKNKFEHGLSQLIYSISKKGSRIPVHNTYSQIITSALTIGFGGSAGLEAPIAVTGAAIGSNTSRAFRLNYRDRTLLLACGTAAGIASVFNSPVAGMVLALELLLPQFSIPAFIPLLIASASATVIAQLISSEPLFVLVTENWSVAALPYYVLAGLLVGYFCNYFTKLNFWVSAQFKRMKNIFVKAIVGGILLGGLIAVMPALYGEGYVTIQHLLNRDYSHMLQSSFFRNYAASEFWILGFALLTLFGKSIAALVTVQAGGNGGSFGPSLVMGGFMGFIFAYGCNVLFGTDLNVTNFIVVGMAACLSGIMHAPLTGIFLIAEITGGYTLMVPLMIASAIAFYVNRKYNKYSIYKQNLAKEGALVSLEDKDKNLLTNVSVSELLEKDFTPIEVDSCVEESINQILRSKKNIFPVIDKEMHFHGLLYSEIVLEEVIHRQESEEETESSIKDIMQPPIEVAYLHTPIYEIMQKMERKNLRTIPIVNEEKQFLGFITKNSIFNRYRQELNKELEYF